LFLCLDQCAATSDSEFKDFIDVLLLTVDDNEFNEAQKILNNIEMPLSKKDASDKNCGFGQIGRNKATLLKVPYFGQTSTSSGHDVLVYETIQELKPKAIVSLGVCDGVRKEAHFLGDVVVSSEVYFLEQHDDDLSNFDCDLGLVHLSDRGKFAGLVLVKMWYFQKSMLVSLRPVYKMVTTKRGIRTKREPLE
jgi:hypothetical protein